MSTFSEWLNDQMAIVGMTQVDLARKAGLTPATVSRLLGETRQPWPEACEAIARALNLPAETVYRKAGLLPEVTARVLLEISLMQLLKLEYPGRCGIGWWIWNGKRWRWLASLQN